MTEVRAWKVRAKFAQKTSQINQEIADEASTIDPPIPSSDVPVYSGETPREIVMLAWLKFEEGLAKAAEFAGMTSGGGPVFSRAKRFLPPDVQKRVRDLQKLRNEAVHMRDFSVSTESALDYARAASKLGAIIRHPAILMGMKNRYQESEASKS
ncbi:hypothetical protein ESZ53_04385 [Salinibacterium sp. UTAS2018]|uniref:hypothetical protein n=1 Tax=Salinibacterium sp. UTAS2018 TaxID=2508880 RepID=UPI0010095BF5|nr:hypothetical protein [Salinibacterium sp. UTAS2018]QAV69738.1 hypothetical protein ESZ53_04385 [Salinibacterium sp. UTAS2018]